MAPDVTTVNCELLPGTNFELKIFMALAQIGTSKFKAGCNDDQPFNQSSLNLTTFPILSKLPVRSKQAPWHFATISGTFDRKDRGAWFNNIQPGI